MLRREGEPTHNPYESRSSVQQGAIDANVSYGYGTNNPLREDMFTLNNYAGYPPSDYLSDAPPNHSLPATRSTPEYHDQFDYPENEVDLIRIRHKVSQWFTRNEPIISELEKRENLDEKGRKRLEEMQRKAKKKERAYIFYYGQPRPKRTRNRGNKDGQQDEAPGESSQNAGSSHNQREAAPAVSDADALFYLYKDQTEGSQLQPEDDRAVSWQQGNIWPDANYDGGSDFQEERY